MNVATFQKKTSVIDGFKLSYWHKEGDRTKTLIFLHGLSNNGKSWFPVFKQLKKHNYEIYSIDLPGFGQSDELKNDENYFKATSEILYKFVVEEGLNDIFIIGKSLGSLTSLTFATMYPELVRKCILVSPLLKDKSSISKKLAQITFNTGLKYNFLGDELIRFFKLRIFNYVTARYLMRNFNRSLIDEYAIKAKSEARKLNWFKAALDALEYDFVNLMNNRRVDIAVIAGKDDHLFDYHKADSLMTQRSFEFHSIENAGHILNLERPESVARIIEALSADSQV